MQITTSEIDGCIIINVDGKIDLYNVSALKERISRLVEQDKKKIIVNLENVTYIDSSGIGALIAEQRNLRKNKGGLKLVSIQAEIIHVFKLSKLDAFFDIYDSNEQAIQAFTE